MTSAPNHITRRWIQSEADEKAAAAGCYFDLRAADRVRQFFAKFLVHSKGEFAGQPFELLDWEWNHLIGPMYGWKMPNGLRRFRYVSAWIAKKNGKSTLAAGVVINGLINDGEEGPEVYGAAADRNQGSVIYRECEAMVLQSPQLSSRLRPVETMKRIVYEAKHGFYAVLSKDSKKTGHGVNASTVVIDELHVVDRPLYDTLRYAGAARRQPLFFEISTAGDDPTSFGFERYTYAKKVASGEIEDLELLPFIAEADSNDVWHEEQQWRKANPSLGQTISLERFRADFETAKNGTPLDKATFCQLRLNIWQHGASAWLPLDKWDLGNVWPEGPGSDIYPLPVAHLRSKVCFAGVDLSKTTDLCALALVFPNLDSEPLERDYDVLCWFWTTEMACRLRERQNKTRLDRWVLEGWIYRVDGAVIHSSVVRTKLQALRRVFQIRKVLPDPYNATDLGLELRDSDGFDVEFFEQNMKNFAAPTKELENLTLSGRVRHGGNPVLRWNMQNVRVKSDENGNIRPSRARSLEKIDGAVAMIEALAPAMLAAGSVYERRGVLTL